MWVTASSGPQSHFESFVVSQNAVTVTLCDSRTRHVALGWHVDVSNVCLRRAYLVISKMAS
jgi:hypothetical protein